MDSIAELSGSEYLDLLRTGRAHDELSAMHGTIAVWVDFADVDPDAFIDHPSSSAAYATLPTVVIATNCPERVPTSTVVDVRLDPEDVDRYRDDLLRSITANPLAANTLAIHLRGTDSRTMEQGLVAESTTYSLLQGGPEFARWRSQRGNRPVPTSTDDAVLAERVDDELRIVLNRPERHNAFSQEMRDALVGVLTIPLLDDSISRIALSGRGKSFCSGGDLAEFGTFASPVESHLTRLTRSPAWLLTRLADRTTAHLHGACYGAGIELPAFVDHVVAAPDTRFCLPEIGLGLIPGAGGTASLPRRIGRHRTALLGLSGAVIDASTAYRWGLIDRIDA